MDQTTGQIIFLNGTSSSGKSSIARELLRTLDTAHYYLPVDAFNAMRSQRPMTDDELDEVLDRLAHGFHRAVAGMAAAGNNVVVDHVLREPSWLLECLDLFGGDVVFVGVHCPLPELQRRERERGDRRIGRAEYHFHRVHQHGLYDVEVDTSTSSPHDCAAQIKDFLARPVGSRAFDRLRVTP